MYEKMAAINFFIETTQGLNLGKVRFSTIIIIEFKMDIGENITTAS